VEYFKAALYSPLLNDGEGGWHRYATQRGDLYADESDEMPGNIVGALPNQANWFNGVYSVTQSADRDENVNYLTDVGSFINSGSYYGTFDQHGNVMEMIEDYEQYAMERDDGSIDFWYYGNNAVAGSWALRGEEMTADHLRVGGSIGWFWGSEDVGFRIAAAVPEPSSYILMLTGAALCAWRLHRRRAFAPQ
jgi:formylglycine-generating enzyme required for sulfatase activity